MIKANKSNTKIKSSMLEKFSMIIKLDYEIENRKVIKLFGYNFFKLNKRKFKIIINNKLCNSSSHFYKISKQNMKVLKVKLIILNIHEINLSEMFYDCKNLKKFSIITKDEPTLKNKIIEDKKDNKIVNLSPNNSDEANKQSTNNISLFNRTNNELEKFYENSNISDFSYR